MGKPDIAAAHDSETSGEDEGGRALVGVGGDGDPAMSQFYLSLADNEDDEDDDDGNFIGMERVSGVVRASAGSDELTEISELGSFWEDMSLIESGGASAEVSPARQNSGAANHPLPTVDECRTSNRRSSKDDNTDTARERADSPTPSNRTVLTYSTASLTPPPSPRLTPQDLSVLPQARLEDAIDSIASLQSNSRPPLAYGALFPVKEDDDESTSVSNASGGTFLMRPRHASTPIIPSMISASSSSRTPSSSAAIKHRSNTSLNSLAPTIHGSSSSSSSATPTPSISSASGASNLPLRPRHLSLATTQALPPRHLMQQQQPPLKYRHLHQHIHHQITSVTPPPTTQPQKHPLYPRHYSISNPVSAGPSSASSSYVSLVSMAGGSNTDLQSMAKQQETSYLEGIESSHVPEKVMADDAPLAPESNEDDMEGLYMSNASSTKPSVQQPEEPQQESQQFAPFENEGVGPGKASRIDILRSAGTAHCMLSADECLMRSKALSNPLITMALESGKFSYEALDFL
jgi:hypothetical protein